MTPEEIAMRALLLRARHAPSQEERDAALERGFALEHMDARSRSLALCRDTMPRLPWERSGGWSVVEDEPVCTLGLGLLCDMGPRREDEHPHHDPHNDPADPAPDKWEHACGGGPAVVRPLHPLMMAVDMERELRVATGQHTRGLR